MTTVKDIAWVAGILDGEGTFTLLRHCPCISLEMSDLDTIEKFRAIVDPTREYALGVRKGKNKPMFAVTLNGKRAVQWMLTIYPLMSIRRKAKIREIVEFWKAFQHKKAPHKVTFHRKARGEHGKLLLKLRQKGYSEPQVNLAKIMSISGKTEEEILHMLEEEFGDTSIH